jgi:hypothetical protein
VFKWVDGDGKGYRVFFFELHILVDELTKDVSLMVVDFLKKMVDEATQLGKSNIRLKHLIDLYSKIVYYIHIALN